MPRVLSIQSHVVSGYVGNKAATFPLQLLGFDVDAINTVQFSNHTGFNVWKGQRTDPASVLDLFEGLRLNGLDNYTHLLTGYMGNPESITVVRSIVDQLRARHPHMCYVLDPVLGDDGHLYVPESMIGLYKRTLLPLAHLVTPNQFELERLTDTTVRTEADLRRAVAHLHDLGVPNVVVTSCELEDRSAATADQGGRQLHLFGSQRIVTEKEGSTKDTLFRIDFPKLDGYFTGTGDLFCALLLAHFTGHEARVATPDESERLALACATALSTMAAVMRRTLDAQRAAGVEFQPDLPRSRRPAELVRHCELSLIRSKGDIESPELRYQAVHL
ncbi:hypothetical protein IWQ60_011450 [Tieghemiomyces parasiticus]|uniref:pyridoxal kinase n=1 Tax=Tieghemiomyces parasiticus TaxID=78921 RepID=A0A9W8DLJ0_9FUNG|nr:hypothetical protein IWQ60_011450 [Tieghemiomyces parasiticus]